MEQILGEIRLLAWDDIPAGWIKCEGQMLEMNKYPLLYMVLGSRFGQSGQFTFALPDLRANAPPGLTWCIAVEGRVPAMREDEGGL